MMENENIKCSQCGSTFNRMFLLGKQGNLETCPVCDGKLINEEEDAQKDWITWYYYKDPEYGDFSLWDKLPNDLEALVLIKEFKAPPESECGLDEVKRILRNYVPDAFLYPEKTTPVIRCPRCGSKEFTLLNKGYSIWTGFLGSGRIKRVCNRCKKEF